MCITLCRHIPSARMLHTRCPVSATPTAFASQIGQFPLYGKQKFFTIFPSAHMLHSRPPLFFSGRAGNACTNLLGFLVRYVRTRGSMRLRRIQNYRLYCMPFAACTCHAWLARPTRARRGGSEGGWRESSLLTFAALLVTQKRDKKNPFYDFSQKIPHQQKNTPFPRFGKARHNACLSRDMLKLNLHLTLGTQYRMSGCRPPVIFLLLTRL